MKSYLDISKCSEAVKKPFKGIHKIPVRIGRHQCDIDVVMTEFPEGKQKILRDVCGNKEIGNKQWPVGFFVRKLPDGAVLHIEAQ